MTIQRRQRVETRNLSNSSNFDIIIILTSFHGIEVWEREKPNLSAIPKHHPWVFRVVGCCIQHRRVHSPASPAETMAHVSKSQRAVFELLLLDEPNRFVGRDRTLSIQFVLVVVLSSPWRERELRSKKSTDHSPTNTVGKAYLFVITFGHQSIL